MFVEKLVYKWGIKNISEFEELESVKKYKPEVYLNGSQEYGYFCLSTPISTIGHIKKLAYPNNSIFSEKSDVDENHFSWTAYLSGKPEKVNVPEIDPASFSKEYKLNLDKGHLIAKRFMQYIGSNVEELKPFFYKNNRSNIIYQFINTNRNFKDEYGYQAYGQSLFEARVAEEIENNSNNIYYQIEPIFFEEQDKIPIGTRIIAFRKTDNKNEFNLDKENIKVPFHVFIPNYDDKNLFDCSEKYRYLYRKGIEWLKLNA